MTSSVQPRSQASPVLCSSVILNANQRTQNGGGLGTRLASVCASFTFRGHLKAPVAFTVKYRIKDTRDSVVLVSQAEVGLDCENTWQKFICEY